MCCESVRETLNAQFDQGGRLGAGLGAHLASCASCARHLNELRRLEGAMRQLEGPTPAEVFVQRLEQSVAPAPARGARPFWPAAAAAAVLATLGDALVPWERTLAALPLPQRMPVPAPREIAGSLAELGANLWGTVSPVSSLLYWPSPVLASVVAAMAAAALVGLNAFAATRPGLARRADVTGREPRERAR